MQVKSVLDKTAEKFGKIDGVACCVGSSLIKPAHLTHAQEFHDAIAKNTFSAFNILKASVSCPDLAWNAIPHGCIIRPC